MILYADTMTDSMRGAIDETVRRRKIQQEYNEAHGITPQTIHKAVRDLVTISQAAEAARDRLEKDPESMDAKELKKLIAQVTKKMQQAAAELDFESAMELRDQMKELKRHLLEIEEP